MIKWFKKLISFITEPYPECKEEEFTYKHTTTSTVSSRNMTDEELEQFNKVFSSMDDTFKEMNKMFSMMGKEKNDNN